VTEAARHIWALVSGYPDAQRRSRFLAILQGFGDDTGKGKEPVFALGGFVASVEQWVCFADAWDAKLREVPSIRYFKAREAAACRGEFFRFDPAQRDIKVAGLISLINAYAQFFVGSAIVREDWNKVFRGRMAKTMESPFFFAYMRLMTSSLQRLFNFGPAIDRVEWIFDKEDQTTYREVLNWWLAQKGEPPLYLSRRMGNHPIMRDDKEVMPLQAADLIAWVTGKLTSPTPNPIAWDWAEQLSVPGTLEVWREENLAQFLEGSKRRGDDALSYEAGAQRSARLRELLGPRR
jgi:hypothetical protein